MKIIYFGNNVLGLNGLRYLQERGDELVGLVVHPPGRRRCTEEMVRLAGLPQSQVFDGSRLRDPDVVHAIQALGADIGLSVLFGYILQPELIDTFPQGIVNLHPALLPWNRGANPNVWSIVDGTPAGVTLHHIDSGVDSGDIVAQRRVPVEPVDTGATLYAKLEGAGMQLLRDTWPAILSGTAPRHPQPAGGTFHRVRDVDQIDPIELDRCYKARELLDILRARTFPPHKGAYFEVDGKRVYVRVELEADKSIVDSAVAGTDVHKGSDDS